MDCFFFVSPFRLIDHFIFQSAVGQIIVVVATRLNVVMEEDLVVKEANARED